MYLKHLHAARSVRWRTNRHLGRRLDVNLSLTGAARQRSGRMRLRAAAPGGHRKAAVDRRYRPLPSGCFGEHRPPVSIGVNTVNGELRPVVDAGICLDHGMDENSLNPRIADRAQMPVIRAAASAQHIERR